MLGHQQQRRWRRHARLPRGLPRCDRRDGRRPDRLSLAGWRPGCSASKPRATGPTSRAPIPACSSARGITNQTKVDAIGLFTGQVGYAWNNVLWYVKGGAAVTDDKYTGQRSRRHRRHRERNPLGRHGRHRRRSRLCAELVGSLRIRPPVHGQPQRHLDHCRPARCRAIDNIKQDVDIGTVRVNYRWGGPVISKY